MGTMRLKGRKVLITGAGSGFGRATAQRMAREGAELALLDLDHAAARATATDCGGLAYQVDVTNDDAVANTIADAAKALGGLDGIVNSAGIMSSARLADTTAAEWRRVLEVNLTGPYLVCKAALPWLEKADHSTIVNIASGQAILPSLRGSSYAASKAGVLAFTKSLAVELAPRVRANVVCPGAADTPMTEREIPRTDHARRQALEQAYALKRLTRPEEVADAIIFLTSSESSAITGVALAVDCGRTFH
jgi:NAD(P)-dependent dehydrogenase (short-subunit alcohol dehydrogenase family)